MNICTLDANEGAPQARGVRHRFRGSVIDEARAWVAPSRRAPALGGAPRSTQLTFSFDTLAPPPIARGLPVAAEQAPPLSVSSAVVQPYLAPSPRPSRLADAADIEDELAGFKLRNIVESVKAAIGVPVEVVLTENRRTMISTRRREGTLVVRLHRIFLRAGPTVVGALARYLSRTDARASRLVSEFIESQRAHVRAARPRTLRHEGHHHDLRVLFEEVNRTEFGGTIQGVGITWGKHGTVKRRRRSIRLGTYTREEQLVRIHPALDAAWIPRYFVRYIVFHELLHHDEPEIEHAGRTEFHTEKFRARERAYVDYLRALAWERDNLNRLLRPG